MRRGIIACILFTLTLMFSCEDNWFIRPIENNLTFKSKLSSYSLFQQPMSELKPAGNAFKYELNTPLFTDYASKHRLIKLPNGQQLDIQGESKIVFPEGTVIAKTFFYKRDQLPDNESQRILETRLLILHNGKWNVGVYQWNEHQTEAYLVEDGASVPMEQVLPNGKVERFTYEIPSNSECTTCHNKSNKVSPIGPKVANLNISRSDGANLSQLESWIKEEYLNAPSYDDLPALPPWDNSNHSLSQRARVYLDVNCAHCHNPSGVASEWSLDLRYTTPYNQTGIHSLRFHIPERMTSNWDDEVMPKIGTNLKHKEGIELIKDFINQL